MPLSSLVVRPHNAFGAGAISNEFTSSILISSCCNQAITLVDPVTGVLSVNAILQQLSGLAYFARAPSGDSKALFSSPAPPASASRMGRTNGRGLRQIQQAAEQERTTTFAQALLAWLGTVETHGC